MGRVLLNGLSVLSLLISMAAAAVWGRSYFYLDVVSTQFGKRSVNVFSDVGSCVLFSQVYPVDYGRSWSWEAEQVRPNAGEIGRGLIRFEWTTSSPLWNPAPLYVAAPHWTLPAALAVLPAVRAARGRGKSRDGHCPR